MIDAGIIGFVPRGEYSDADTYDFLQFVYYKGSTYVAKKETTGNTPAESNEYWQILARGQVSSVSGVKGEKESEFRVGDVNLTAQNVGALPDSGGKLNVNANPILSLNREGGNFTGLEFLNQNGHLFTIEGYSAEDGTGKQLNIYARDLEKSLLRINENGRVIYDYKTKDEKEILVNGEALPLTGGEISGQLNIKSRYFPLINLVRAEYGETAAIQLTNGNENQKGFLLEGYLKDSEGSERNFHIRDRILNKELFMVSPTERKVYDKDSGSLKKILVEGEALLSTGGTIASTNQQMLNLRCTKEKGDAIIQLYPDNLSDRIAIQAAHSETTGMIYKVFKIENNTATQLLELSSTKKNVYNPSTSSMKEIIVKGDDVGECVVNGKKLSEWLT